MNNLHIITVARQRRHTIARVRNIVLADLPFFLSLFFHFISNIVQATFYLMMHFCHQGLSAVLVL